MSFWIFLHETRKTELLKKIKKNDLHGEKKKIYMVVFLSGFLPPQDEIKFKNITFLKKETKKTHTETLHGKETVWIFSHVRYAN